LQRSEHDEEISVSVPTLRCIGFLAAPCGDVLSDFDVLPNLKENI
jgi:hypothetical protein